MKKTVIDMTSDPRRAQFALFRGYRVPYVGVSAEVDVTRLRASELPFFLTLLHCAIGAANAVPELRRRIVGEQVVEYGACLSSHTVALPDGAYTYCTLDCAQPLKRFLPYAAAEVERAKTQRVLDDGEDPASLFFVSSLPWLRFTDLTLPVPEPPDSNVRITFGQFFPRDGRVLLPVNLTAHHALADGIHLARFFEELSRRLDDL